MMKKSVKIFVLVTLLFSFKISNVLAKDPETLGDLRKIYNDLLYEKQQNDNKSAQAKKEAEEKRALIQQAEKDLALAEMEQHEAENAIDESNARIESLKKESEKVLQYMQQVQGQNAYVEYVSGASSMTDLITRIEAVKQVSDYIQGTVDSLEAEIKKNEQLVKELEEKQKKLDAQIISYEDTIKRLVANAEEYDKFANTVEEKLEAAKKNLDSNVKTCKENLGKTDDSVKLVDCSKIPVNGGWLKPLKYGVTTSTIGYRWGSYHNAIDIGGNAEGTPIYAAAAGQVASILNKTSCGGNRVYIYVIVDGVKYTTFYYHLLKINVKVGDIVDQNTVIGTVGGGRSTSSAYGGYDTCTTGAHLHFGVAKGWYPYHVGSGYVITPPGFPNREGYRFTSRTDFYKS